MAAPRIIVPMVLFLSVEADAGGGGFALGCIGGGGCAIVEAFLACGALAAGAGREDCKDGDAEFDDLEEEEEEELLDPLELLRPPPRPIYICEIERNFVDNFFSPSLLLSLFLLLK